MQCCLGTPIPAMLETKREPEARKLYPEVLRRSLNFWDLISRLLNARRVPLTTERKCTENTSSFSRPKVPTLFIPKSTACFPRNKYWGQGSKSRHFFPFLTPGAELKPSLTSFVLFLNHTFQCFSQCSGDHNVPGIKPAMCQSFISSTVLIYNIG